jgi:hypothetical protein
LITKARKYKNTKTTRKSLNPQGVAFRTRAACRRPECVLAGGRRVFNAFGTALHGIRRRPRVLVRIIHRFAQAFGDRDIMPLAYR